MSKCWYSLLLQQLSYDFLIKVDCFITLLGFSWRDEPAGVLLAPHTTDLSWRHAFSERGWICGEASLKQDNILKT
jgi:hypothetical protein